VNVAADDEAQKKIADVRACLRAETRGGRSLTSTSKANGGLIGPFSHDDMSPSLRR
jgi:hypothetical protein